MDPEIAVTSAGLDDAKRNVWVLGKTRRQHASRGPCANHNNIEFGIKFKSTHDCYSPRALIEKNIGFSQGRTCHGSTVYGPLACFIDDY